MKITPSLPVATSLSQKLHEPPVRIPSLLKLAYSEGYFHLAYDKCFAEAVEHYNARQKRSDRRIKDGYFRYAFSHAPSNNVITAPDKRKSFYEDIVQIGCKEERVIIYLTQNRGIDAKIVNSLIEARLIAEEAVHHNCMFIGRDSSGTIRSCALRGTGSVQFRGEVSGGDKSHSFAMVGTSNRLRVFESPIDAMSHATFSKLLGIDWHTDHRLSANGCGHTAVLQYLREHSEITSVVLSLDNDQAGNKGANAIDEKIRTEFTEREITISRVLSQRKDWNEDLIAFRIAEKSGVSVNEFLKSAYPQVESSNYSFQQSKEG